jgi:hypothetical protein
MTVGKNPVGQFYSPFLSVIFSFTSDERNVYDIFFQKEMPITYEYFHYKGKMKVSTVACIIIILMFTCVAYEV